MGKDVLALNKTLAQAEMLAANTAIIHIGHTIYLRKHFVAFKRAAEERIFVTKPVLGVGRKRNLADVSARTIDERLLCLSAVIDELDRLAQRRLWRHWIPF